VSLATSPAVAQAAVIAWLDAKWGERPVLIVELRADHDVSDEDLVAPLKGRVPSWWMPDALIRLTKLPLAAPGKIDKQKLRAEFG